MLPCELAFGTPRKLPKVRDIRGTVAVLDVAFAGQGGKSAFENVTQPFIDGLGDRLRAWVDHHDHDLHARFAKDPRFVLATKQEHGACPEMITRELVERIGPVDTIVCHTDFDGLASAAKWMLGGEEPYRGCDADARAIDTRIGEPSPVAVRIDRAVRARYSDQGLLGLVVKHLATRLADDGLWRVIDEAASELAPVEAETRRAATQYDRLPPGVAIVDVSKGYGRLDKTMLLLIGQEREAVSVVVDEGSVSVAAAFDSGRDFLKLFGLSGGMPTRVSLPKKRLPQVLKLLEVDDYLAARYLR
jgi:hypothetical protein